ncbi:ABC transporter permease [Candidatus Oscillochloris fontis]|uniref:ABC transporter permease n=1 Tax=Candidatus Oscillochloris fontis TaxID=2496868 RepID=UPI00101C1277|nr:ABC-2 family transporter protein [Candidatus Oscillochloris fontis]
MRHLFDFYRTTMKLAVITQLQYRTANYFYMIGMIAEPIIYLVVWSTIARAQGGSVGGYTSGSFAAYYIVWTLVRNMNIVFTPYGWEWRIQHGELSAALLRPIHPLHRDIAYFAGWKVVVIILWLPLAAALALLFRPELHPTWPGILTFLLAIWGAYLIRTMLLWCLGMLTFWTTRVSAIYELFFAVELLLSGRLVPMALLPSWAQHLARYMPFQWTFGFPIEALVGQLTPAQLLMGLAMQILWIGIGLAGVGVIWRQGMRAFTAVGN